MDIRESIAAERRELAAVLSGLSEREWDAPSLCEGWRVREVVAHMVMPFRYSRRRFVLELAKARGKFDVMADRCARRDAALLSPAELAATLRDNATHPWRPPGGGDEGALTHDVIHGLDITVALGLDRRVPAERLRAVLSGLTKPKGLKYFGVDVTGTELRADDLDWSYGSGRPVSAGAERIALLLCRRFEVETL